MRFDTPVYFQRRTQGAYNPTTGDYAPFVVEEVKRYASVTNAGESALQLAYGELRQGSLTVRIAPPVLEEYDRIRIGDKVYRVDMMRRLRNFQTFVVSEVQ